MLGYIRVDKEELRIKDHRAYRNVYCALCNSIGKKYGLFKRMLLSYDVVFIILCLDNFENDQKEYNFRCPVNMMKKVKICVSESVLNYCAALNYYLAVLKCKDDCDDERSLKKEMLLKILSANLHYKEDYHFFEEIFSEFDNYMLNIKKLENENTNFDDLSNYFGEFFVSIFMKYFEYRHIELKHSEKALQQLLFNMGKWVYVIDAYEDYKEDKEKNNFNLLGKIMDDDKSELKKDAHKRISFIIHVLLNNMETAFEEIPWIRNKELIKNIIVNCQGTYYRIIKDNYSKLLE